MFRDISPRIREKTNKHRAASQQCHTIHYKSTKSSRTEHVVMIFSTLVLLFATASAVPDCFLPFLTATDTCSSAADCGSGGACVYSINRMQRVCCVPKDGAVQPQCPSGKPSPMPVLCDPNSEEDDVCPDDYKCLESVTDFEKDAGQPNYVCCH
ncbi:hypothetical protein Q1695_004824 [Nippostrongylus brasiliensis]|nr:hypothetical protein Q1695_004824 [Nippostrongylus brasiliensis]